MDRETYITQAQLLGKDLHDQMQDFYKLYATCVLPPQQYTAFSDWHIHFNAAASLLEYHASYERKKQFRDESKAWESQVGIADKVKNVLQHIVALQELAGAASPETQATLQPYMEAISQCLQRRKGLLRETADMMAEEKDSFVEHAKNGGHSRRISYLGRGVMLSTLTLALMTQKYKSDMAPPVVDKIFSLSGMSATGAAAITALAEYKLCSKRRRHDEDAEMVDEFGNGDMPAPKLLHAERARQNQIENQGPRR